MHKKMILCVDDEEIILTSLSDQLMQYLGNEYVIETAESGEEALEVLEEFLANDIEIPLIISDQIMPGINGDEFLVEVHRRYPQAVKMFLTGQANADSVGHAVNQANLSHYIAKPWDEAELKLAVMEALYAYTQAQQAVERQKLQKYALEKERTAKYALQDAKNELERQVQARTLELMKANTRLHQEVIERRRLTQILKENQRSITTLLSNLPGIAYRCRNDSQWTMEFISDGCYPLTGYPPESFLHNAVLAYTDIIAPEDRETLWDNVQTALQEQQSFQVTYRITTKQQQQKWVWEQGQGVFDTHGTLLALEGFITDVTAKKMAAEELEQAKKAAEAASRSKSEFLANMTHELRTPLNSILGFAQLMNQSQELLPKYREFIQEILRSGNHLFLMIERLLEASRLKADHEFDLQHMLDGLAQNQYSVTEWRHDKTSPDHVTDLSATIFSSLSNDVIMRLRQAVMLLDLETAHQVIDQLRPQHEKLADDLKRLVNEYRFDVLQKILDKKTDV